MARQKYVLAVLLFLGLAAPFPSPAQEKPEVFSADLDRYIASALRDWEVPGAAIAIVRDGHVIVVRGYGVRELGKPERVDADTIFDVASLTKSFTSAAVASLMDEKRLSWDDPVQRFLPTLKFPDPYLTANTTLRDLLCHRTGIRATNSAWYFTNVTRPKLLDLVRNMEIEAPFRTRLVYSNVGYTIAGEAAAAANSSSWEELVTHRLIAPLGMTRTTADFNAAPAMGNYASGHEEVGEALQVVPRETTRTSTAPAGAVQSSAKDLSTWMLFQLGDGSFQGRRILTPEALEEMHSIQIAVPTSKDFRVARQVRFFVGYGLGWQVFDYRGNKLLWHSGSGDGQRAYMALLPESHLGVAVLTNSSKAGVALNAGIAARVMDHYLGLDTRDYSGELRDQWTKNRLRAQADERKLEAERIPDTSPSLPLATYAGAYVDRLGLDVKITLDGNTLRLQYGDGEIATLKHWHHDTFRVAWQDPLHAEELSTFVSFELDEHGKATQLHMEPFGDMVTAHRTTQ
jgi:CubicO group peptidase (beta-lactamase class C family)